MRYGGHTSCIALAHDGDDAPTLLLDAGTGVRRVSGLLAGAPFNGTLLLGHLHWDHTQGIPFFQAGDRDDARVQLLMPEQGDATEVLRRAMSPPHFPIGPEELLGRWDIGGLEEGKHRIEGFDVLALDIPHKGGRTLGYRISDGRSSIAYLSDHGPLALGSGPDGWGPYHDAALALADGVDLLIHDAQQLPAEVAVAAAYGHSITDYAVRLGELAGAREALLFHHSPSRTDDEVDAITAGFADHVMPVTAAAELTTRTL